mmetsp:Transcript_37856/g.57097  ORF Transcript_37856/g.57097 Transcript_37856/m.57097 type:complete len:91 (-) Transcript_37856:180-452(-)
MGLCMPAAAAAHCIHGGNMITKINNAEQQQATRKTSNDALDEAIIAAVVADFSHHAKPLPPSHKQTNKSGISVASSYELRHGTGRSAKDG